MLKSPRTSFVVLAAGLVVLAGDVRPADAQTATAGQLIISEFRLRGPSGATDEFIEIYNNIGADHTVVAASGTGYGVAASDATTRCSIPNGTVIPAGGHYLCVNSDAYSLGSYPAGNGTTATGDATFTTDIPTTPASRSSTTTLAAAATRSPTGSTPWARRRKRTPPTRKAPAIPRSRRF
jgi:hypothetical protein